MAELRWNPVLRDWTMVAGNRQSRPQMPKNWCPFCPGSGKVPEQFDVYRYPNDFPALRSDPPEPDDVANGSLFQTAPSYGRCEVLLYSPDHHGTVAELSDAHVHRLARMWREVFDDMRADPKIKYCYLFENRGAVVGVTMPHPHGQAYGYPFLPSRIGREVDSARSYLAQHERCLFCDLLKEELADGRRILFQNKHFTAYLPFYSPLTYGANLIANRHVPSIGGMTGEELDSLGEAVRSMVGMYDSLFDMPFPYMMCMHNAPIHSELDGIDEACHFYIEFIPPMRGADRQQFFASSETGAGAWCNPNCPEEKAPELRAAYEKYQNGASRA
ncbi:galactose-1-phosphate uridylyltransferase [Yanshouia hominis]|uniref:Galactose-1-phosphate uridylyltransferase n=1 Tax=Yanshouia hominis TaxID=2763673 RepID=A0ABR7NK23_9FIRM|nr:galactose-1-phosphate uridylyltransferase [Yanshouia hominis]MBC8576757.1 galactose-1-phosphate uridylyltransferase [Yanshouia hominis]